MLPVTFYGDVDFDSDFETDSDDEHRRRFVTHDVGLRNQGNTCYMDAVIQALVHVPPLRDYFALGEYAYDVNCTPGRFGAEGKLAVAFGALVKLMSASRTSVTPDKFKRTLGEWNPIYAGNMQQDASHLLEKLLEGFGDELNRLSEKEYFEHDSVPVLLLGENTDRLAEIAAERWVQHTRSREDHPVRLLYPSDAADE